MMRKQVTWSLIAVLAMGLSFGEGTQAQNSEMAVTAPPPVTHQYTYVEGACYQDGQPARQLKPGEVCTILHQVKKDENLHILSAYYYGDARAWRRIFNMNRKTIRNPNVIYEGQILVIEIEPGWVPRYDLERFMEVERARLEIVSRPGQGRIKRVETEETVTPSATIDFILEEAPPAEETTETPAAGGMPEPPPPPPEPEADAGTP